MAENPVETLLQLAAGHYLPRCLHAVANLGVADALDNTPQPVAALAEATGSDPAALDRVLRILSANGVFEFREGRIAHTAESLLLRTDHPRSMRSLVRIFGLPAFWASVGELEYSIRTGQPCADKVLPGGIWGYLSGHPADSRIFDEAMAGKAHGQIEGIIKVYDFSIFSTIVDIGGGRGHLLQSVLSEAPQASGVLFDLSHVIQQVAGIASDRLRLQPGDFFNDELPPGDAYLLMEVIHDWDDVASMKILKSVRRAAPSHSKVLLIEAILPDDPGPNWPRTLDIAMLAIGGRQRTLAEYSELCCQCGFAMTRAIGTDAGVSILEAIPV
ncbi:methyltransferase [Synechococcus sp. CBW1107]|uniref:methyltransferase n=1 Tax=Synechococcus sp. CBW1107 TaxID=2789857 RepID=UPI002AD43CC8|nr:methyltransferase [Synechococcus sp. CBW1107]CAK6697323.1 Multifunctional cyclase-dehydratase-3-O-methyl transferase TcmN [Synechococcus sp. CBW1107]